MIKISKIFKIREKYNIPQKKNLSWFVLILFSSGETPEPKDQNKQNGCQCRTHL